MGSRKDRKAQKGESNSPNCMVIPWIFVLLGLG